MFKLSIRVIQKMKYIRQLELKNFSKHESSDIFRLMLTLRRIHSLSIGPVLGVSYRKRRDYAPITRILKSFQISLTCLKVKLPHYTPENQHLVHHFIENLVISMKVMHNLRSFSLCIGQRTTSNWDLATVFSSISNSKKEHDLARILQTRFQRLTQLETLRLFFCRACTFMEMCFIQKFTHLNNLKHFLLNYD